MNKTQALIWYFGLLMQCYFVIEQGYDMLACIILFISILFLGLYFKIED